MSYFSEKCLLKGGGGVKTLIKSVVKRDNKVTFIKIVNLLLDKIYLTPSLSLP